MHKISESPTSTEDKNQATFLRRTIRHRSKPQKYMDFLELSPSKRAKTDHISNICDEDECPIDGIEPQKPTTLFTDDDVDGQDIFKFKSQHSKHDLQNKIKSALNNSPRVVDSPLKSIFNTKVEATPKLVKELIKKRIVREIASDESDSDFSGSSSDYVPENEGDESQSSSSSVTDEDNSDDRKRIDCMQNGNKPKNYKSKPVKESEYFFTPDNYFMMNSSKKITTSDHTLARLKNLNLNKSVEEDDILITEEHKLSIASLNRSYEQMFDKWLYVLSENFNLVLYGIGSKRMVLQEFQRQKLHDFPCIVVNGFFPSLTIKSILDTIVIDLLENNSVPSNLRDVVKLIDTQLTEGKQELFLIIHNIDGPMLRNAKAQTMLACLSQIKNVHTIATIDHINAPLLWDHSKLSKFNFTWWDATTFMPYSEETSYENSLLSGRSGALQLASLASVHRALTANARGVFDIITRYQLANHKQAHYQGLPFKDLYSKCREQFLVSSDVALRAQLTEFLDHKLIKIKRTLDGSENLVIPIDNSLLQQFLDEQKS